MLYSLNNLNSLQIKFLIFIAVVLVVTIGFAILIWHQTIIVEAKALAAKKRQQEYQSQLDTEEPEAETQI